MPEQTGGAPQETRPRRRGTDWGPIVIILVIATVVFFVPHELQNAAERRVTTGESSFSSSAVLSGVTQRNTSTDFRGGKISAVLGGVDIDLREATMQGHEATIDVSAFMGGVDIRVPRSWTVVNQVTPVLGGVDDNTHSSSDADKRLIVVGSVWLGGLDIKN